MDCSSSIAASRAAQKPSTNASLAGWVPNFRRHHVRFGAGLLAFHIYKLKNLFPWHALPPLPLTAIFVSLIEEPLFKGAILAWSARQSRRCPPRCGLRPFLDPPFSQSRQKKDRSCPMVFRFRVVASRILEVFRPIAGFGEESPPSGSSD